MKPPRYQIESVRWIDAEYHTGDPVKPSNMAGPCQVLSVGIVANETPDLLYLAIEVFTDGTFRDYLAIPKSCITKRKRLTYIEDTEAQ